MAPPPTGSLALLVVVAACAGTPDEVVPVDARSPDASQADARAVDASPPDAAPIAACATEVAADAIYSLLFEAQASLVSYYNENRRFPVGNTGWVPAAECCSVNSDGCCVTSAADWGVSPWSVFGFSVDQPSAYRFQYTTDANAQMVRLVGERDLDCDGTSGFVDMACFGSLQGVTCRLAIPVPGTDPRAPGG
ncbi:MAG: hypothetical protein KBG48_04680 [Kofleriaceae bacterium]|jgi:hypothetical protein|nr:hypothetical protein [Kofleriaceae bacterium]MBP9166656.1 hypothetical protein [Kofleriaceae bacterium]MBP9858424.1 hypothetical protein [Kofleriaceae bacterium]